MNLLKVISVFLLRAFLFLYFISYSIISVKCRIKEKGFLLLARELLNYKKRLFLSYGVGFVEKSMKMATVINSMRSQRLRCQALYSLLLQIITKQHT